MYNRLAECTVLFGRLKITKRQTLRSTSAMNLFILVKIVLSKEEMYADAFK